jgi:hypothetical protein
VRRLILEAIQSVEQLEILLLLAREPERSWQADDVARELRTSPRSGARWLAQLAKQKFLREKDGGFRFAPEDAGRVTQVEALAQAYVTHRVSVIDLIFNRPRAKLQGFADAFKIREDE